MRGVFFLLLVLTRALQLAKIQQRACARRVCVFAGAPTAPVVRGLWSRARYDEAGLPRLAVFAAALMGATSRFALGAPGCVARVEAASNRDVAAGRWTRLSVELGECSGPWLRLRGGRLGGERLELGSGPFVATVLAPATLLLLRPPALPTLALAATLVWRRSWWARLVGATLGTARAVYAAFSPPFLTLESARLLARACTCF